MNLVALSAHLNGRLIGDGAATVSGLSALSRPRPETATFLLNAKHIEAHRTELQVPVCVITIRELAFVRNQIVIDHPKRALKKALDVLYPDYVPLTLNGATPVCSTASVKDALIHPFTCVGLNTVVSAGSVIYPNCTIGAHVRIGKGCVIYPNVTLYDHTVIGDRVVIHAGTTVGGDGFGYVPGEQGLEKIQHIGSVVIGDDVEIGSNCSIDRGCLGATMIQNGTKLDNLVHVAHNVEIGAHCAITSQVGFVGSAVVKDRVQIGGQAGIMDVVIGSNVIIGGRAGVTKNVPDNAIVSGFPAQDHRKELREQVIMKKLIKHFESSGDL